MSAPELTSWLSDDGHAIICQPGKYFGTSQFLSQLCLGKKNIAVADLCDRS